METVVVKREEPDQFTGFQNQLMAMRQAMDELRGELRDVKKENEEYKRRIVELEDRVDFLDNQSRRENLVIRGIPEKKGETSEECEQEVIKLGQQIGVELCNSDFARAKRVPCKNGPRPIIAKFTSSPKREQMLKEKKYLRGTNISVMEDFSKRTIEERKALFGEARKKWNRGEGAYVRFNKLYTNNAVFRWDVREGQMVQIGGQLVRDNKTDATEVSEEDVQLLLKKLEVIDGIMQMCIKKEGMAEGSFQRPEEGTTYGQVKKKEKTYGN